MERLQSFGFDVNSAIPKTLDVTGCHTELTVCGHVDLVNRLPIRNPENLKLVEQYLHRPGSYEGRYARHYDSKARLLDYGNDYIALRIYDDITRPELGEFLLAKGWKMIAFSSNRAEDKTYIIEKWCNIRDH